MNSGGIAWVVVLTVAPMLLLTLTCFVKISVVLAAVRNALGAPEMPSGLVVTAMAFVLTLFVMAPIALQIGTAMTAPEVVAPGSGAAAEATDPTGPGAVLPVPSVAVPSPWLKVVPLEYQATMNKVGRALQPLREFLRAHSGAAELATFRELANRGGAAAGAARGDELWVLAPAFVTSELTSAFSIAMLLLLPFLLIDVLVAVAIGVVGLPSLSPQTVALPLKLLLFVAVDGWRLLIEGLLRGYT